MLPLVVGAWGEEELSNVGQDGGVQALDPAGGMTEPTQEPAMVILRQGSKEKRSYFHHRCNWKKKKSNRVLAEKNIQKQKEEKEVLS